MMTLSKPHKATCNICKADNNIHYKTKKSDVVKSSSLELCSEEAFNVKQQQKSKRRIAYYKDNPLEQHILSNQQLYSYFK